MATATTGRTRFTRGVTVLVAAPSVGAIADSCGGNLASRSEAASSLALTGAELIRSVAGALHPLALTTGMGSVEPSPLGAG